MAHRISECESMGIAAWHPCMTRRDDRTCISIGRASLDPKIRCEHRRRERRWQGKPTNDSILTVSGTVLSMDLSMQYAMIAFCSGVKSSIFAAESTFQARTRENPMTTLDGSLDGVLGVR